MIFRIVVVSIVVIYLVMWLISKVFKEPSNLDSDNPYLESEITLPEKNLYEKVWKPILCQLISFIVLVLFSPIYLIISIAVFIDDPGPIIFSQKRIGKDKHYFELHKFRTMKMSAPHDVPTHQLANPDEYITRVGKFLRKTSLDEIPQAWDGFRAKIFWVSVRPALWNQADLIEERDQYGANSVRPGITGWAQINGRDELEITTKARLDGEYVKKLRESSWEAFKMDCKCFFGTFMSVIKQEGVVEGGTGNLESKSTNGSNRNNVLEEGLIRTGHKKE